MDDPLFVKRFAQASRPGAYLRIIEEGELGAGDRIAVERDDGQDHGVSVQLVSDAILNDPGLIPQALSAPQLIPKLREHLAAV
jgi:MOSC domain-containing protein YiiM